MGGGGGGEASVLGGEASSPPPSRLNPGVCWLSVGVTAGEV